MGPVGLADRNGPVGRVRAGGVSCHQWLETGPGPQHLLFRLLSAFPFGGPRDDTPPTRTALCEEQAPSRRSSSGLACFSAGLKRPITSIAIQPEGGAFFKGFVSLEDRCSNFWTGALRSRTRNTLVILIFCFCVCDAFVRGLGGTPLLANLDGACRQRRRAAAGIRPLTTARRGVSTLWDARHGQRRAAPARSDSKSSRQARGDRC